MRNRTIARWVGVATLVAAAATPSCPARAADDGAPAASPESEVAVAPRADAPRGAMLAYLVAGREGDWERAAAHLNLRALSPARRTTEGPTLARELKTVLDRALWVEPEALSNDPEGDTTDDLPPGVDRVGVIDTARGSADVLLERVGAGDGRVWKIAAGTVARIPALYDELGYGPLATYLPPVFFEVRVLEVQLWQWVGLALLLGLAVVLGDLGTRLAVRLGRVATRRSQTTFDDRLLDLSRGPLRVVLSALVLITGVQGLALAVPVHRVVATAASALLLAGLTWLVLRGVDVAAGEAQRRFTGRGNAAASSVVPLARRTAKVVLGVLALVVVLQNFGFNVTGFLAGLGVVGLAAALAAQTTVENFFGGISLIADRPVRVGDFCRFGDRVGTIEDIGLRTTRIRTLDRTLVSVPNGEFSNMQLESFTARDRIWLHPTLGLRYETTPDQLRHVLVELKKVLLAHPKIDPEPARVRFVGFGAYSLDLEVFAYVRTRDFNEFLAVRQDVFLRFMDVVEASGTGFAFPSQTIYAGTDGGLDATRARAAEEEVGRWRAERRLYLPDVPDDVAAGLADTLDYPPKGSPGER